MREGAKGRPRECVLPVASLSGHSPREEAGETQPSPEGHKPPWGARLGTQGLALGPALPGRCWGPSALTDKTLTASSTAWPHPGHCLPLGSPRGDPLGDTAPQLHPEPTATVRFQVTRQEGEVLPADRPRPVVIETLQRGG